MSMRTLIVDADSHEREAASRYLQSAGHSVVVVSDARAGLAAIDRDPPDIIVLAVSTVGMSVIQFIQRLRQKEQSTRSYLVVVSSRPTTNELSTTISAGADDYMRKPLQREELIIRVGALERIRGWATRVFGKEGSCVDLSSKTEVSRLEVWRTIDRLMTRDIGEFIGQSLARTTGNDAMAASVLGAQIPLSLASERTEVRLRAGLDANSLTKLGESCLGDRDAPEEALRDVLRELVNTAGGAFVRAAAQEGVSLTCGLPVDLSAKHFGGDNSTARQQFVLALKDGSLRVTFEVELLAKALRRVNVRQLLEGMVLARDLHTEGGALLVPGGTCLTSSQIDRMRGMLSTTATLDVAEAA
jgi:DNA-binding response OmpR family regulator